MDAYVARQPIFNQRKKIIGYELLFRNEIAQFMPDIDGDVATSTVLGNTFFNIGTDNLVGDKKSFINFTQNLLLQKVPLLLPREGTVVEILENVEPPYATFSAATIITFASLLQAAMAALIPAAPAPRTRTSVDKISIILTL